MDLLRTTRTYASRTNAETALAKVLAQGLGIALTDAHYLIALNAEGRYAPVVTRSPQIGMQELVALATVGITVVG